ncbi:PAS domain-containing hybrid sensor histidine kinase/response regulator [Hyphococcus lacteus]|uniref:histidine kinase n=1 Tax=Hyphococcus lacteus TaxID=3143536 RepID=A0ABV3Z840_9PROT
MKRENLSVALFENAPEAVAVADVNRQLIAINPAFTKLFGYNNDDLCGQLTEVLYEKAEDYHEAGKERFNALARSKPTPYEVNYRTKAGVVFPGETIGTNITDNDGNTIGFIGFIRDISERKKNLKELEQARREAENANHAKSLFLANMSHEIRTPLNGVLGMATALGGTKLDDTQRQMLGVIAKSGKDLLSLLNDLLDLSKVEAGAIRIEATYFNLADLTFQIEQLHAQRAREKNLNLSVTIDHDAKGCWHADPMRIRQVLHNLMSNAIKFTKQGSVELNVSCNDEMLIFTVKDTGIGIDSADYDLIFELFRQAGDKQYTPASGAGLGLSISRRLARLMGGDITVESVETEGTIFTLAVAAEKMETLTRADETSKIGTHDTPALNRQNVTEKPFKVLVAEDNVTNQMVLEALLKSTNVEYEIVDNGRKCLDRVSEKHFDAVLMDIKMPVMDGVEATLKIRANERRENKQRLPILALTANAMAHQIEKYEAAGMDGCIAKPYRVEDLIATLHCVIEGPRSEATETPNIWHSQRVVG